MSNYVFRSSLRYVDYLQARSFEDSIRGEISTASRSLIATAQELSRDHIAVLRSMSSGLMSGFEQISFDVRALSDGIAELNSTFQWGFSEVLSRLGGLNDSLRELIKIAKTPAQTWAYEQFEIARDAYRQKLYEDAIQYLNRAISGYGDHTGYNLEYRFHHLLGIVRIGSFENYSKQIVDLPQAEQAFLNAAKYAKHDHPKEAARSYLCASWSAYCQGNMKAAEAYALNGVSLDGSLAEAYFIISKVQAHNGNIEPALISLRSAIRFDRGYTIKACTDGDFSRYQPQINSLLENLRQEAIEETQRSIASVKSAIDFLERSRTEQFPHGDRTSIVTVEEKLAHAESIAKTGTYYSYLDALLICKSAKSAAPGALQKLQQTHQQKADRLEARKRRQEQVDLSVRMAYSNAAHSKATAAMWLALGGIICLPTAIPSMVLGLVALNQFRHGASQEGKGLAYAAIAVSGTLLAILFHSLPEIWNFFLTHPFR